MKKYLAHFFTRKSFSSTSFIFVLFFACYILIFFVQRADDAHKKEIKEEGGSLEYILPESFIKSVNFGFRSVLADYYWINIIQNSGLSVSNRDLFLKYHYNIATLDPQFSYPYSFAILWLPSKRLPGSLDAVIPLAERGMKAMPDNWEIPYYLAFQYQIILRAFDKTGKYLAIAASKQSVPPQVTVAYKGYVKRLNRDIGKDSDFSEELLKVAYDTAKTPSLKKIVGDQLLTSYANKALVTAIMRYKTMYKKYPSTIDELLEKKILILPEGYQDNFSIFYNRESGEASVSLKEDN